VASNFTAALARFSGPEQLQDGGAGRDRTGDLLNANQALSQLSYSPRKWLVVSGQCPAINWALATGHRPLIFVIEADWTRGTRPARSPAEKRNKPEKENRDVWTRTTATYFGPLPYGRGSVSVALATFS
jgi:hypothetical protein